MPRIDENGNLIYTRGEYEHYLMMDIPLKSGFVENYTHRILDEVIITTYPINVSETHFMSNVNHVAYSFNTNRSETTPLGFDGYEHLIGPTLIGLGQPIKYLKPIGALGSKPGSSIASYTLSKAIPSKFTSIFGKSVGSKIAQKVGTNVAGRAVGRAVPYAGWFLTAWDVGRELGQYYGGDAWVRWYKEYKKEQKENEFQESVKWYLDGLNKTATSDENSDQ